MKGFFLTISAFAVQASAFPFLGSALPDIDTSTSIADRATRETNCGPNPCKTFDASEQYVDISAASGHDFRAPRPGDLRGPCPGLNAAANHGYLPRNGIATTAQTITGLADAFGMGADIAAGLAVIAIALEGNPITGTWSIGGAYPAPLLTKLGAEQPQGIAFSHNNYEGDGSVTRNDAYLNNGNAYSLNLTKFEVLYNTATSYTIEDLRSVYADNQARSISTNPYFFNAQFSGLLVVPAAHHFIINFMSNHSAAQPSGYLDRKNLKSFFGVTGKPGSFVAHPGQERIPDAWYRRPSSNQYTLSRALEDVALAYAADPSTFKFGGNTGSVNSFTGIDIGNLTGGAYNSETLLQGNNLGCFVLQAQQQDFPDVLKSLEGVTAPALKGLLKKYFDPLLVKLECPKLEKYNQGLFNQFPGYKYRPTN